jgi:hypothetical protein
MRFSRGGPKNLWYVNFDIMLVVIQFFHDQYSREYFCNRIIFFDMSCHDLILFDL